MRFFTMVWWCGVQEGLAENPSADYFAHLTALRDRVPPERLPTLDALLSLALHDARLLRLRVGPAAGELRMLLESYSGEERFALAYSGVEQLVSAADPERRLSGSCGYGDIGYDEVDALPAGAFVHRVLFSSGIEMAVVFHGFELLRGSAAEQAAGATRGR
jgi:hypothetical protein